MTKGRPSITDALARWTKPTCRAAGRRPSKPDGDAAPGKGGSVLPFELEDLVFDSELLALEVGQGFGVGQGSADFLVQFRFEMRVAGAKRFETILKRH
jgi:hypothetical protein